MQLFKSEGVSGCQFVGYVLVDWVSRLIRRGVDGSIGGQTHTDDWVGSRSQSVSHVRGESGPRQLPGDFGGRRGECRVVGW